jgi:hypothetical protein
MIRRTLVALYLLLSPLGARALARPARPQLTPAATALIAAGPVFLVPEDNLAVPLQPHARSAPFLAVKPERLEVVAVGAAPLLVVDDDLYRLAAGKLSFVAARVGAVPAASADGALIAGIEDKRALKLTHVGGVSSLVPYHRTGNWELDRPYVTPDGAFVLAVVRDYTRPIDAYDFLVVNAKSGEHDEIHLEESFVPGEVRQPLSPTQVALPMGTQQTGADGFTKNVMGDWVVFDFKTKKLGPAPAGLRPGVASPDGKYSIVEGRLSYSDDKRCGGDETLLYEEGKTRPASFKAGEGVVVSALDFVPDSSAVIANVLTLKSCKTRGVLIPLAGDAPPSTWKPFPLPVRGGRLLGRVIPTK